MRIRSLAPLAAAVALSASLIATSTPAAAETVTVKPETFAGGAAARALDISVLNQRVTLGDTIANIVKGVSNTGASTYLAKAVGTGQLSLLANTTSTAALTSKGKIDNTGPAEKSCGFNLPVLDLLNLASACGTSLASIDGDLLNAVATGQVADLNVSANSLLSGLGVSDALPLEEVTGLVGTLTGALNSVTGSLPVPVDLGTTLDDLLTSVTDTKTLQITVGDAVSKVTSTANTVTASSHSSAVDIKVLPLPKVTIGGVQAVRDVPILEIIVGEAKATATYDRLTGKQVGDPTFDPALVRIKSSLPLLNLLGITSDKGFAITPGQKIEIPGIALIELGFGEIVDDGIYGKKAVADGLRVELLSAVAGGIVLNLAHAEAGAIDNLAQTKVLSVPSVDIARDIPTSLPRTGAEEALPLALAGVAISIVAVRRARMAFAAK